MGRTAKPATSAKAEILSRVSIDENGCWRWQLGKYAKGYGIWVFRGRTRRAHRASYEAFVGEIPSGLVLDHLCRVRDCVNPEHLEPVTHRENILRGDGHAARNARKTTCKKGHELSGDNLKVVTNRGFMERRCRTCDSENWKLKKSHVYSLSGREEK